MDSMFEEFHKKINIDMMYVFNSGVYSGTFSVLL